MTHETVPSNNPPHDSLPYYVEEGKEEEAEYNHHYGEENEEEKEEEYNHHYGEEKEEEKDNQPSGIDCNNCNRDNSRFKQKRECCSSDKYKGSCNYTSRKLCHRK